MTGLPIVVSGVKTTDVGICALSFLTIGAACEETAVDAGAGDGAGGDFGGGCAMATIEAAATANMTIVLFIIQPRPTRDPCQGCPVP